MSAFSDAELNGAKILRSEISDIPDALNADYFLARWWRMYKGDLTKIRRRLQELFDHRRLLGYDDIHSEHLQTQLSIARKTFEILKVIPLSYVIHSYFILQESFTRAQLAIERSTGKPAQVIAILDLSELNVTDFLSPLSVSARFARLIIKVWADYFGETLTKSYVINSPALFSVMWRITRFLMDETTRERLEFLSHPTDLVKRLDPSLVPEAFSGKWRDDSGYAEIPELICQRPIAITSKDYYDPDQLWREFGYQKVPSTSSESIRGGQTLNVPRVCTEDDQLLVWHFTVNGDVEFSIVCVESVSSDNTIEPDSVNSGKIGEHNVWPKITLTSLKCPEQGHISCKRGKYEVRFCNPVGTWFPIRVHYAVEMCPPNRLTN